MKPITVTHVSTYDTRGGAGIAATRLHLALCAAGVKSSHLVRFKSGNDPQTYLGGVADMDTADDAIVAQTIQREYIDKRRTSKSNTLFSLGYPGIDVTKHPAVAHSDIVNLHWVSSFLSVESIGLLLSAGSPLVWTLHDQHAFTGGCHYSAGCLGFMQDCSDCPQLVSDPHHLASTRLKDRMDIFSKSQRPVIVTPSEWMRQCALHSRVFGEAEIVTIPNSVPIERFNPGSRRQARRTLGIDDVWPCVLFGAENQAEKRKGFAELMKALRARLADPTTAKVLQKTTILCFGEAAEKLTNLGLRVVSLGKIEHEDRLRLAYVAADFFVLPSHEDNLPNTILESLACGTPVLAFNVGGIPEAVRHDETGWLIPKDDTEALGHALVDLLSRPARLQKWSPIARKDAVERFSPSRQAQRYLELYDAVLRRRLVQHDRIRTIYKAGTSCIAFGRTVSFDGIFHSAANETVLSAYVNLVREHQRSEADRCSRGEQIESLTRMIKESQLQRGARNPQIESLTKMLKESEADRAARAKQIESLTKTLKESEADRAARAKQIESLTKMLKESEADKVAQIRQIKSFATLLKESESDRAARGKQIAPLTKMLKESEADRAARLKQIESLTKMLNESEVDRAARGKQIMSLTKMLKELRADGAPRLK